MSTQVSYNGVTLYNVVTRRFEQEPVYDKSGTDLLYFRIVVGVTGYVHAGNFASSDSGPFATSYHRLVNNDLAGGQRSYQGGATVNFNYIRSGLTSPRGKFRMWLDANSIQSSTGTGSLLSVDPGDGKKSLGVDLNNGPKPKSVRIGKVVGDNMIRIEFEIELCVLNCDSTETQYATRNESGVLSNRWSMQDDIDENFYTVRTVQGVLVITSATLNPHSFRNLVMPPLTPGFRRDRVTFVASADGLTLEYTIVDREMAYAPPKPATKWELRHTVTTGNGLVTQSAVNVVLYGNRDTDKHKLFELAARIIEVKGIVTYALNLGQRQANYVVRELTFTDVYSETANYVEARAIIQANGDAVQKNPAWQNLQTLGSVLGTPLSNNEIPGYDNLKALDLKDVSAGEGAAGTASVLRAFSAYLQTPCSDVHAFQYGLQATPEAPYPDAPALNEPQPVSPGARQYLMGISEEHRRNFYTRYQAESKYETDQNSIQLPIAAGFSGTSLGNPDTSAIVVLSPGTGRRVVRISAERVGAWPTLPTGSDFVDGDVKYTALGRTVIPGTVVPAADGQLIYTSETEYEFALNRPLNEAEQLRTVYPPWLEPGFIEGKMPASAINQEANA